MGFGRYRFRRSFGQVNSQFRGARPSTYPNFQGLLDLYPGAAAAYSLRALSSGWLAGDVVEVREDTGQTTQSFTAAQILNGDLETFCGVGDGFVSTWYDQSGNANDATQITTTAQPKIVDAGSLVTGGVDFDGVDDSLEVPYVDFGSSAFYMNAVAQRVDSGGSEYLLTMGQGGAGQQWSGLLDFSGTDPNLSLGGLMDDDIARKDIDTNGGVEATEFLLSMARDGNTGRVMLNGVETTTDITGLGSLTNTNQFGRICAYRGASSDVAFMNAKVQEIIIYASDQTANSAGLEANQNDFYTIY